MSSAFSICFPDNLMRSARRLHYFEFLIKSTPALSVAFIVCVTLRGVHDGTHHGNRNHLRPPLFAEFVDGAEIATAVAPGSACECPRRRLKPPWPRTQEAAVDPVD